MYARNILIFIMDPMQFASFHPSITTSRYTFTLEVIERVPSKHSYKTAQEAADIGLRQGLEKYKDKLVNVYIIKDEKVIGSWK